MSRKRIILVTALLLPVLVLGGCGKRSALKRTHPPGVAVPAVMPSAHGVLTKKATEPAPIMPNDSLPEPEPFGTTP